MYNMYLNHLVFLITFRQRVSSLLAIEGNVYGLYKYWLKQNFNHL